ncbi:hypothetical protein HMPREF1326_02916 [Akkermansia sp. KLE1605]|nr:hypothetical protein HMPREF1326_02916 [Akkermansia sp. KLE1605]
MTSPLRPEYAACLFLFPALMPHFFQPVLDMGSFFHYLFPSFPIGI